MNLNVSALLKSKWTIPASVGVTAFSSGFGAGYIFCKRHLTKKAEVEQLAYDSLQMQFDFAEEFSKLDEVFGVNAAREQGLLIEDVEDVVGPESWQGDPRTVWVNEKPLSVIQPIQDETPIVPVSVFRTEHDDKWDYEAELSTRTPDEPYVIHQDEFFGEEMGFDQTTLTFYNEDNILTDEKDVPIYGHTKIVGALLFGHGSNDQNVVYIRNEQMEHEWEIICSMGSYEVEVMGLQIEQSLEADDLKHSHHYRFKE